MHKFNNRLLGNILILFSILLLLLALYPFIRSSYFSPDSLQGFNTEENAISTEDQVVNYSVFVPRIGVSAQVILNVDPWNPEEYKQALEKGIAHAKGTSLPGEGKTSFLFAHSSTDLWRLTNYNAPFYKLGKLKNGDEIIVRINTQELRYIVFDKKEVWPEDTKYLKEDQGDILILQTCTPIGTNIRRLLVFARPSST